MKKCEIYKHIYKDAEMSTYTIKKLINDLKEKDNKIKKNLEDILEEYESFKKDTKSILEKEEQSLPTTSDISKMMASMGIKKEVKHDNSDSSISDLLIQGISLGKIDMEKKIKSYDKDKDISSDEIKYAKKFLKFQDEKIKDLKKFL